MGRGALLILLLAATAAAGDQIPLPVKRSTILRKCGVTYYVEGRQKIPQGCEISIHCWFVGLTKKKEIRERVLKEENDVRVKFGKINKRPLGLAGPLER